MWLRHYILIILLGLSSWSAMAQQGNPTPGKYASGDGSGFARSAINFGSILTITPNPVCEQSEAVLTIQVKGEGIFTYEWKKVGSTDSLSTTANLTFTHTALSNAGRYYCMVSDGRMTVSSDTLELEVIALPIASITRPNVSDTTICNGDTLMLMGTSNVSAATLTWNGTQIIPTASANIIKVAPLTETVYTLKADNRGCTTKDTIHIRINTPYISVPSMINTSEGNKVEITARDRDGEPIVAMGNSLAWYKDGQKLSNANPLPIQPRGDMEITVKHTAGGCSVSGKSRILVKGAGSYRGGNDDGFATTCLPPVIIAQHGIEREQCVSLDSTELVVVAEGTNIRYQWQKLDHYSETFVPFVAPAGSDITGINSGTLKIRKVSDNINGLYRCVLSNACSGEEVISDTFNVSIKGEPIIKSGINIGRDQCVASGQNVTWNIIAEASAGTGHLTYRWYKDGRQISAEADTLLNYYHFQITNSNGSEQGTYVVHVANECGTAGDTAFLPVVFPPKAISCSRDVYACTGNEAEFTVKPEHNGDYTYELYKYDLRNEKFGEKVGSGSSRIVLPNVTTSGTYRWIITHPYCGVNTGPLESLPGRSDVMYLWVEQAPVFTLQPSPATDTTCIGSNLQYNCIAKSTTTGEHTQPIRYNWYREGVLLNGTPQNDGILTLNNVQVEQGGFYYCMAFNSCPPVKSNEITLKVMGKPQFAGSPTALSEYCTGDSVSFRASLSSIYPADSVRWYFAGKPLQDIAGRFAGTNTMQLTIDSIDTEDERGIFQLRAYNRCEYSSCSGISFKVRQPARFIHSLEDNSVKMLMCSGENQTLTVEATGTAPLRFTWLLNGDTLVNSHSNILDITGANLDDKGKYSCHVQNSCGDEITATYIEISRPDTFRLIGGGNYCTNNEGVNIYLEGSDTSAIYRLYNKTTGQLLKETEGRTIQPPFSKIPFENLRAGTYYVTATDTNFCEYRMPGEAIIREYQIPAQYNLLVTSHLCPGITTGTLQLTGSQPGIEYVLCTKDRWTWDTIAIYQGTGAPINMPNLPAGDYKVHARNLLTGCEQDMPVIATLKERPAPALCELKFNNDDSTYCINTNSNVAMSYPCYENGNTYQLYHNGRTQGSVIAANQLHWPALQEGRYELKITNNWGCTATTASRQVITQALPTRFQLIGSHYFCEYDQDSCFIELSGSNSGTRYAFRRLSGSLLTDTLSHGGPIRIGIWPPVEEKFYVIATDTTVEHCSVAMTDTIALVKSRLKVIPVTPVIVNYNDSKQLSINITGYQNDENDLHINWENRQRLISSGETTSTPTTVTMTESHYFPVTVTDANCHTTSGVQVNCIGGDLKVEIKNADHVTTASDTLKICGDETLSLYAMATGGATGQYAYSWWDNTGELGLAANLTNLRKTTEGYIWLEARDNKEQARDSIWVVINESPRIDTLLENGLLCIPTGSPVVLTLKNSQSVTQYQVEHKADGGEWQELAGLVQNGTDGQPIQFMIHDGLTVEGRLRIRATIPNKAGDGYCEKQMAGEAEVRRGAIPFNVSGGGAYCVNEITENTILLDGSENDVVYHLVPAPAGSGETTLPGNGAGLSFTGKYPAGKYRIVGATTYCRDTMTGNAEIIGNPLPVIATLQGAGKHCTSEIPVSVSIDNGMENIVYTLLHTAPDGTTNESGYQGKGNISFGELTETGTYTITAKNTLTGCQLTDSREIRISPSPADLHFEGEGHICGAVPNTPVSLKVYPIETGAAYTLIKTPGITIGTFNTQQADSLWYNGSLSQGDYIVKALLNECEREYTDTLHILGYPLPVINQFIGAGGHCTSEGPITAGIDSGQKDVVYTLTHTSPAGHITTYPYYGENAISFGTLSEVGVYTLSARDTMTGCEITDPREIRIGHTPADIHYEGEGYICQGETATNVKIKLYPAQAAITYTLIKVPDQIIGNFGSQVDDTLWYSGQLTEGSYTVKASVGECEREYTDLIQVSGAITIELPEMTRPLSGCENNPPIIGMNSSTPSIVYTLYRKASPVNQSVDSKTGDGNSITFSPQNLAGNYFVQASDPISGCYRNLYPEYSIEKQPATTNITGETEYCETAGGVTIGISSTELLVKYHLQRQNSSGEWEDVTGGTLTGSGSAVNFYGRYPAGTYRVVAGTVCQIPMDGILTVTTVSHPNQNLALRVDGNPCIDSTLVLSTTNSETGMTYTLYKNTQAVDGSSQAGGGPLEWTITPDEKALYTVKTTVRECTVTLKDSVSIGRYAPMPAFAGDTVYCDGNKAEIYLQPYLAGASYVLYDSPAGNVMATGQAATDRILFNNLEAGIYYAQATDGNCVSTGKPQTIRSATPPTAAIWALNDCVASDSGQIIIRGLDAANEYILSQQYGTTLKLRNYNGDTTLSSRPLGIYSIVVRDTASGCLSPELRDTIREGVYADSINSQLAYCAGESGAILTLSGIHREINYSIRSLTGTLQTIRYPQTDFRPLLAGSYIFEKVRTGNLSGCSEQQSLVIRENPAPKTDLQIATHGDDQRLCSGNSYQIEIKATENGKQYLLQKNSAVHIDTLYGDGSDQLFNRRITEEGTYRILVSDTLTGCQEQLDTIIRIYPLPKTVIVENCHFCESGLTNADRCGISLNGMIPGTRYRLQKGHDLDTLTGYGRGTFALQPAGHYLIIAEDETSGCTDTLPGEITALPAPLQFAVAPSCQEAPAMVNVRTDGSQGDTISYTLYKDGIPTILNSISGTGSSVGFDNLADVGVYRIHARNEHNGCGTFMQDSVVIYLPRTEKDTLIVIGDHFCENASSGGAILRIPESTVGWKYYITNGLMNSDTLTGNGRQRSWMTFDGQPVTGGSYELYAISPCGTDQYIARNKIEQAPAPELYPLENNNISLCPGGNFELKLTHSDENTTYIVKRFNTSTNILEKEIHIVSPADGPLSLGHFNATGLYEISANNGCPSERTHTLLIEQAILPDVRQVLGSDVCIGTDGSSIALSLQARESDVYYYLYADDLRVDSLIPSQELSLLDFRQQTIPATYTVIAEHQADRCSRKMDGTYHLSHSPGVNNLLPAAKADLCEGEKACIQLDIADAGVIYSIINQNGSVIAEASNAEGASPFTVGCVTEAGTYSIKARVGSCSNTMNGTQVITVTGLPYLSIEQEYHFCDGGKGIQIEVAAPTNNALDYRLYDPGSTLCDRLAGSVDGGEIIFKEMKIPGYYKVEAYDGTTGCAAIDSVELIRDSRPMSFELSATNNGYICEGESVNVSIDSSETSTLYTLYKTGDENPVSGPINGTGTTLTFPRKIKEAGTYYVQAMYENGLQCISNFGSLNIRQAQSLTPFRLIRQKSSYCYTDEAKGSLLLEGSQNSISYRLTKDGEFIGYDQWGDGNALSWIHLEGKPCAQLTHNADGYRYRVVAIDTLTGCTRQMLGDDTITEVNPVVLLAQEPSENQMIRCEGTKVQFSATVIGCRETYTWYRDGGKIPGANKNYYNIDLLSPTDYGEYYCEATNACGVTVSTTPVNLEIRELVKIETPLADRAICDDRAQNILLAAGFRNATSFRWYKADVPEHTLSNSVYLEMSGADKTVMGQYVCVANNQCEVEVRDTCEVIFGQSPDITMDEVRIDTLCVGGIYDKLRITSGPGVEPQWYRGTTPLNFTGERLILSSVTRTDEGPYLVKASNACGESTLHIGTLYVDDYMHVTDASDPTIIRCLGDSEHLFVNIDPAERVKYTWSYTDGTQTTNGSSQLTVGPFQEVTTQIYWVRFMNKCGMAPGEYNYREFVVHVPQPFVLPEDLPREIITCSDSRDTVIRLNMDPATYANYKWWYRKNRNDISRIQLPSAADTLAIPCRTANTGFYYCDLSNECDAKTTETIWVRIDTIPVIRGTLSDDTICEGGQLVLQLPATGGGLHYDWKILKKGTTVPETITDIREDFESTGELRLTATAAYDSCVIWCDVHNNCGEKLSNTMVLRIDKRRQIEITPADTTICAGSYAEIHITLHNGSAPWCYHYVQDANPEIEETRIAGKLTDTLYINLRGDYTTKFVSDGGKCNYAEGNSTFRIRNYYVPEARIALEGKDSLCIGEKAQASVTISYPPRPEGEQLADGPWELTFVNNRGEIMNELMGVNNPLTLYRQDGTEEDITYTIPPFILTQSETIYIGSIKDLGANERIPCQGIAYDSAVFVISAKDRLQFDFRSAKDTLGICETIKLDTLLRPNLPGSFAINGITSQNNYFNAALAGEGKHIITYQTQGNCSAKGEVHLWVMPAPTLAVTPTDTSLCPGKSADISISANGCAPFHLKYEIKNEQRDGSMPSANTFEKDDLPVNIKVSYSFITDSLRTITPLVLTDRFHCPAIELPAAKVHLLSYPDFELSGQYPETDGDDWKIINDPFIINEGDYVNYKISYTQGTTPWYVEVISPLEGSQLLGPIYGKDTIYKANQEGRYQFTAVDAFYCMKPGYNKESFIFFREKGYMRIRTMLQGPYIERNGKAYMRADLQRLGILQHEGLTDCPVAGTDSIVDVIVAELRENMDAAPIAKDTFLLRNDGQLLTRSGNDTLTFSNTDKLMDADKYYIVLSHRNHLAVISATPVPIVSQTNKLNVVNFDFTVNGAAYCPTGSSPEKHMTQVTTDCWAMAAGYPIVENELITISNPNLTKSASENEVQHDYYGYYWRDVNMNGIVEFPVENTEEGFIYKDSQIELFKTKDFWILHRNRNKYSAVPPLK